MQTVEKKPPFIIDDSATIGIDLGHNTAFNWCVNWCESNDLRPYDKDAWGKAKAAYLEHTQRK